MDINCEEKTFYATQYQEAVLKYVENTYSAKNKRVPVSTLDHIPSSNFFLSSTASGFCTSSFDPYDLSSDDEEYLMPNNVACDDTRTK